MDVFQKHQMKINLKCGKTEGMLQLRGQGACEIWRGFQTEHGPHIPVPRAATSLHLVSVYKHLGCEAEVNGSNMKYVKGRASKGMAAYGPISTRIFGNRNLSDPLKQSFQASLVSSRQFLNAHVRCLRPREQTVLNNVYMRVVRRIADAVGFDGEQVSDKKVRRASGTISADCLLLQNRLKYMARLERAKCAPLKAMSSLRNQQASLCYHGPGKQFPI